MSIIPEQKYIWFNGNLVKWKDAKIHVVTHALHYGSAPFEGIRFYDTSKGPAVFRLNEHIDRLFYSCKVFNFKVPFTKKQIKDSIIKTIKANKLKEGYVRPIIFSGYGIMRVNPDGAEINVAVIMWPWACYLCKDEVNVGISKYIRHHPKAIHADAKVSGYYTNCIFAELEIKNKGYDEALMLDYEGNIAEGPGENFFMVKNKIIYTPKLGSILPGITRQSIIQLARDLGYKVKEKTISLYDVKYADECFFTGTAAEVTGIGKIEKYAIGTGKRGKITTMLRNAFLDIVHGKNKKYNKWLSYVG